MSCFDCLSSNQLIIFIAVLALALSDDLDADDLSLLGSVISSIGGLMGTKATKMDHEKESKKEDLQKQIYDLKKQLEEIKHQKQ